VDPHFAEAYNRRATVHFGLKNAEECFADIERVLSIEPFHYGALCGKGLMLMKLGRSAAAVEVFERAIAINPVLGLGALGKQLKQCQEAAGLRSTKG
jgi:tetratricopeptide (TPR) repeat protein